MTGLDGNSIAGLLESVFGRELTEALGVCGHCGAEGPGGELHVDDELVQRDGAWLI